MDEGNFGNKGEVIANEQNPLKEQINVGKLLTRFVTGGDSGEIMDIVDRKPDMVKFFLQAIEDYTNHLRETYDKPTTNKAVAELWFEELIHLQTLLLGTTEMPNNDQKKSFND